MDRFVRTLRGVINKYMAMHYTTKYINDINDNGQSGYILEVDLEYPQSLHEYHNSYPFSPERKLINRNVI